jgi:hypothetical protein
VKSLGEGVMLYIREPSDAVSVALDLVEAIPATGLPPATVGINSGLPASATAITSAVP